LRFYQIHTILYLLNQTIVNHKSEIMSKKTKSRRAVHNYNFDDKTVNLNGYVATCTITGDTKKFYHSYLANMIVTQYNNNFQQFEDGYISRAGKALARKSLREVQIQDRINKLYAKIAELKTQAAELTS